MFIEPLAIQKEDILKTVTQRYESYFRVVKTIFYEGAQRMCKILFLTREIKFLIFRSTCNVFLLHKFNFNFISVQT